MISISRSISFWIIGTVYVHALMVGLVAYTFALGAMSEIWALFLADVVATIVTWIHGLIYKNVSVYDPYWSVAPPVLLALYALASCSITPSVIVLLTVIMVWAVRLTGNWAVTFQGLAHEDWRYTKYRDALHPVLFHVLNLFGLNMMPTVVVFLAMMPAIRVTQETPEASLCTWVGALMCLVAVLIQYMADTSAHRFRRENPGKVCRVGLWKYGRHPNYFGEILMWWGVWVQSLALPIDWTITGAIVNTLLFLCVSIPLMEARQLKNKPDYAAYRKETRMLI